MATVSKFYFKIGGKWVYQGQTSKTSWSVGTLNLQYAHAYSWRVDVYDTETGGTETGDTWTFTIQNYPTVIDYERPDDYNPDEVWGYNPITETYEWMAIGDTPDITAAGGGRYGQRLVAVGHNVIYFSEL